MAGSIDELRVLAEKLETKDGGPKATKLSHKIRGAIPRFEAGEEVSLIFVPFSLLGMSLGHAAGLYSDINDRHRNANGENTGKIARNSSSDQSLDSHSTKVAHGERR